MFFRSFLIFAVLLSAPGAFAAEISPPTPALHPVDRTSAEPIAWWRLSGLSKTQVTNLAKQHNARLVDIDLDSRSPDRFSVLMIRNAGIYQRDWWWYFNITETEINALTQKHQAHILRLKTLHDKQHARFSVILVKQPSVPNIPWWWKHAIAPEELASFLKTHDARLVDLDVESVHPLRFNAVMVANRGSAKIPSWFYFGQSQAQLRELLHHHQARLVDLKRYSQGNKILYAAIMIPQNGPQTRAGWWYVNLPGELVMSVALRHGARITSLEAQGDKGQKKFTTLMVDNGMASSGRTARELLPFDRQVTELMKRWDIPGASLAIVKDKRLVHVRGLGFGNLEGHAQVLPLNLFRIGGISKLFTRAAIYKLRDKGKLSLSDRMIDILAPGLNTVIIKDKRVREITIEHLLNHQSGWDVAQLKFDPQYYSNEIATKTLEPRPVGCVQVIRYMLSTHALAFAPGSKTAYSNFGYCILGQIIEKTSGETYESFVREQILKPAMAPNLRLGRSLPPHAQPAEVKYYDALFAPPVNSVFPATEGRTPGPYGGFHLEAMGADNGWLAAAIDLVRFAEASNPKPQPGKWVIHGSLPGTRSILLQHDDLVIAVLFNSRPKLEDAFEIDLLRTLQAAIAATVVWPKYNLFGQY